MMHDDPNEGSQEDQPWLYAELHQKEDLDEVIKAIFRIPTLPEIGEASVEELLGSASGDLMGYLFVHVHQAERFLKLHKRNAIPPGLAAWDLGQEAVHELLV